MRLTIKYTQTENFGFYECQASNSEGSGKASVELMGKWKEYFEAAIVCLSVQTLNKLFSSTLIHITDAEKIKLISFQCQSLCNEIFKALQTWRPCAIKDIKCLTVHCYVERTMYSKIIGQVQSGLKSPICFERSKVEVAIRLSS